MASRSLTGARDHNEDDLRYGFRNGVAYAVLSDGAGGHRAGALASDIVVRAVTTDLQRASAVHAAALHDAVHDAHELLLAQQPGSIDRDRMHATLVALWIDADRAEALWSHVGDSRLYVLRDGRVQHVTRDDSVVRQLVDAGLLTPEAARTHPKKNQLLCAMGVDSGFVAHTIENAYALGAGDVLLLATDGWWEHFEHDDIAQILADATGPGDWLARMEARIRAAAKPDQDNQRALAVWTGEP